MKKFKTRFVAAFLAIVLLFSFSVPSKASKDHTGEALNSGISYLEKNVTNPSIGSIGGEWTITALARNNKLSESTRKIYLQNLLTTLRETQGNLSNRKYTEYSRIIIALSAMGMDASRKEFYNMAGKLAQYDKVIAQGINGPIWALIALNTRDYSVEDGLRERYVQAILEKELPQGGFGLLDTPDDMTAMAVQALAPYKENPKVKSAIERSLKVLSEGQKDDGGFSKESGSESISQAIMALSVYDVTLLSSDRFIKNGKSLIDGLLSYRLQDGSYAHVKGEGSSLMATEQAVLAFTAYDRALSGKSSIWNMTEVPNREDLPEVLPEDGEYPGFKGEYIVRGSKGEKGKEKNPEVKPAKVKKKSENSSRNTKKEENKIITSKSKDGIIKKEELGKIKGKEENLEARFSWGDGENYTVTIYGKDVKQLKDFNIKAKKGSKYELDILKLAVSPWIFSIEYPGKFPAEILFETDIDLPDGQYLLMKYNAEERKAELCQKIEVKDGKTKFILKEGGDYFIAKKVKTTSLNDKEKDKEKKEFKNTEEVVKTHKKKQESSLIKHILLVILVIAIISWCILLIVIREKRKKKRRRHAKK